MASLLYAGMQEYHAEGIRVALEVRLQQNSMMEEIKVLLREGAVPEHIGDNGHSKHIIDREKVRRMAKVEPECSKCETTIDKEQEYFFSKGARNTRYHSTHYYHIWCAIHTGYSIKLVKDGKRVL